MRATCWAIGLGIVCLSTGLARGQTNDDLRQQIRSLQDQLARQEQDKNGNRRVSEIGGSREPERPRERELVLRLYDVSDLFAIAPPYAAQRLNQILGAPTPLFPQPAGGQATGMGGMMGGGMGGGLFAVPEVVPSIKLPEQRTLAQQDTGGSGTRTSLGEIVSTITTAIAPSTWDEAGGSGTIHEVGNSLLISATPQVHRQIEELLNLFRERWRSLRTLSIRACWLWLSDAEFTPLLMSDERAGNDKQASPYGVISADAWKALLAAATGPDAPTGYRVAVTCYNGQMVSAVSSSQSLAVTGFEPNEASRNEKSTAAKDPKAAGGNDNANGGDKAEPALPAPVWRPVVKELEGGAALQVTPVATRNGKYAVLDLHSQVTLATARTAIEAANDNAPAADKANATSPARAIDRPSLVTQRLATTLRVPLDQIQMVGGSTLADAPDSGRPHLVLFVKVSMQELRDDVTPSEPAALPPDDAKAQN